MSQDQQPSAFGQFMAEMRRRHVVRFALGYAAVAFVVLQLAEIVFPAFGLGEAGLRVLVIVVALGFPPATVLAWVFDITADGIKRTEGDGADSVAPRLALLVDEHDCDLSNLDAGQLAHHDAIAELIENSRL